MARKKPTPKQTGIGGPILVIIILYVLLHSGIGSAGPTASCHRLERLWVRAGGTTSQEVYSADVAMAESNGEDVISPMNSDGSHDYGYWQINSIHGSLATLDPLGNAKAAVIISHDGKNWSPWVTVQNGLVKPVC